MNVLVTDGENRSALAVTRSLGRRGHTIFVAGLETNNLSACSKYCKRSFQTSNPLKNGKKYLEKIVGIVDMEKIDIIFPITEQSIYLLNRVRDKLPRDVILACASSETMEAVSNKYRLFQMAEKLGVAIPETIYVLDADDILEKRTQISGFPVVVKPAYSKIEDGERIISTRVMYAASQSELTRLYETKTELRYPSLVQELIVGEGTGLFTLFDHGHHLALFSHRRLLEKPPSGGVSVLSESVLLDDEMVTAAGKLLSEVQWTGIAMVEFKRDKNDGKAKLMEINGRFWGSLQLAVSSGIDFPALCLDYYLGKKTGALLSDYKVGHRLKWFLGILDHLIIRIKSGERLSSFPADFSTRWKVTKELFKIANANTSFDVYDSEDLKPFFSEVKTYLNP